MECVVTAWGVNPGATSTVTVANFPDPVESVAVTNFPPKVVVSRVETGTVNITGLGAVTATSDCGVAERPSCEVALASASGDLTALWAVACGLALVCLAGLLVGVIRR